MKLLLDTCALLWLASDRDQLSDTAVEALSRQDAQLYISAISAFEIAVKVRKRRLALPQPAMEWFKGALTAVTSDRLILDCPGLAVVW